MTAPRFALLLDDNGTHTTRELDHQPVTLDAAHKVAWRYGRQLRGDGINVRLLDREAEVTNA